MTRPNRLIIIIPSRIIEGRFKMYEDIEPSIPKAAVEKFVSIFWFV